MKVRAEAEHEARLAAERLGVQARALGVPRQRDVRLLAAADRHRPAAAIQLIDALLAAPVAVDEERKPQALGREPSLVLRLGRDRDSHLPEKMFSKETKMFTMETKIPVASQIASASVPCLRR